MFNAISAIILFFHCKTKDIDCPAQCNNTDFHLFPLAFPGLYQIFFALVAYLQNIKQNVIQLLRSRG